jgi:hypothetical protein
MGESLLRHAELGLITVAAKATAAAMRRDRRGYIE